MTRRGKLVAGIAAALLLAGAATGVALARSPSGSATAPRLVEGKSLMVAAAAYLGLRLHVLKGELHPGHPLAAVARSTPGRSVSGLRAALFHDAKGQLGAGHTALAANEHGYTPAWLRHRIAAYVEGVCPLHMSQLKVARGSTCPGMSM
jgi:hypothetical protein